MNTQRKHVEPFEHEAGVDAVLARVPVALVVAVDQPPAVEAVALLAGNEDLFAGKLRQRPTAPIGYVPLAAHVRLITVKKIDNFLFTKLFQLTQHLHLVVVDVLIGSVPGSFPYSLVSAAKLFKKRRRASRPTGVSPSTRWASHSALVIEIRWRLALTASRMASWSSCWRIEGLRPRPGLVSRP